MANHTVGQDVLVGQRLGHYRIIEQIGSGGMGVVYCAHDEHLDREIAIKVLRPGALADESSRKHFRKEALALSKLNHPNIATIHDFDTQNGVDFLVMEYIPGVTLNDKLAEASVPEKQVVALGVQLAEGLSAAHEHAVIHRDLKPGNLRITTDGRVKILDFGLAKLRAAAVASPASETLSETYSIAGTLPYMAPEQVLGGEIDAYTDIYAAGAVLYEMATGQRAFPTMDRSHLAILRGSPRPADSLNPKLSPELSRIVGKCLEKEPADRYQSAKELAIDLRRLSRPGAAKAAELPVARRKLWKVLFPAALILAAGAIGGSLYFRSGRTPVRLTDSDTIVLSDFNNTTGDSVFDDTLKQGLSVQLEQSPFLALVSDQRVGETLKLMGRAASDRLTPEVTREVCQRTGSRAMLTGSIAALGNQYVIGVKAVTCDTGDVLVDAQEQAAGKEAVLKALDAAALSLRSKLGESLSSVQKYATPLQEATTPSLEALKAYSLGFEAARGKEATDPVPFFNRALELDPNFAMAYLLIGNWYFYFNQPARSAEYARKAYALREKVTERERFFIEGTYYLSATGELEKAAQSLEFWQQTYPRDSLPVAMLGWVSVSLGNWKKALEQFRKAMPLDPDLAGNYINLGDAYMSLNRLNEAEAVYKQADERKLEHAGLLQSRYFLAFVKDDRAQMAQLVSAALGKPGAEDLLLATQADTEGWYGKLKNAQELTLRAMDSAQHNGAKEAAAVYEAAAALRDVESGNREEARVDAKAALRLATNRDVRAIAALALARAGDTAMAGKLAAELDQAFPLDTLVQRYWLPTIRAAVALERQDPTGAVELLKGASTIELGEPTSSLSIFLCPAYLRGEAYLMLRDGNRAAAEFQKFIDYPGVVMNFPWGALARLGLARAYAMQGDTARARAKYQDFLTLWKDADLDIPILRQAKGEYAKLK